jgi:hypothetical protein
VHRLTFWGRNLRYIDSGNRHPQDAVGRWLEDEALKAPAELRFQSGFFGADGLAVLLPALSGLRASDGITRAVIGSNNCETLAGDVNILAAELGLGRQNAHLGIIAYANGFFHPKTYHFRRSDGSQAAYVGSANLSGLGVSGQHIEAGIILDTASGDPPSILDDIAGAVDAWWVGTKAGFHPVSLVADISALTARGVLRSTPLPAPRTTATGSGAGAGPALSSLRPLISLPKIRGQTPPPPTTSAASAASPSIPATPTTAGTSPVGLPVVTVAPYPPYVLFAPNANTPTTGASALTGASLPGSAAGLIVRLNRDSARHWMGGVGTANLSVPVAVMQTLRFGMFKRRYDRPRAEFGLEMRYWTPNGQLKASLTPTGIMVYGFAPGETGHGDVRMVVPKPPASELAQKIRQAGYALPQVGDAALIEWPTANRPTLRMTILDRSSPLHTQADQLLRQAVSSGTVVGQGAAWLTVGLSPNW